MPDFAERIGAGAACRKVFLYGGLLLLHLLPAIALMTGTSAADWLVLALLWPLQALGATLGLHRYFAHRAFKTSRWVQALLAACASLSFGDPIGFAGKHRLHHRYADTEQDVHAPHQGIWQCWIGSLFEFNHSEDEVLRHSRDLCRYPELLWLHRYKLVPGLLLCAVLFVVGGFSMVAVGFALGVLLIIHLGGAVNYFCHHWGRRRFDTADSSTNNWFIALLSLGEGWHNNHHRYQSSARAGLYWWEIDMIYWVICVLERVGLVWAVRRPADYDSKPVASPGLAGWLSFRSLR